jgi:[ribosomal protein S5]-alanine N-acetyltransferase
MRVCLETERLLLREFIEEDAPLLFALDGDPEVMRYIRAPQLPDVDAYRRRIRERFLRYYAAGRGWGLWPAVEKATGEFLGWFCLRPALDYLFAAEAGLQEGELELGYRLRRAAWGKGYATEGSRALVRKAFADPTVSGVVACALVGNVASTRVMQKAGLRREREFELPGYDQAGVKYVLSRAEYERALRPETPESYNKQTP